MKNFKEIMRKISPTGDANCLEHDRQAKEVKVKITQKTESSMDSVNNDKRKLVDQL